MPHSRRQFIAMATLPLLAQALGTARATTEGSEAALVAAARKEGKLVWYSTLIVNQIVRPMVEAFEKKYPGISVQYSRATNSDTALKIINEARAHRVQADVFDGSNAIYPLLDAGLVGEYRPKSAASYPADLKDPDGHWTAMNLYFMTTSYNTDQVKGDDIPKTWDDLLNPKWKGRIAWTNDPTPQGPPGFIHNILATMGEEKGMAYLKQFAAQQPVFIPASQRVVLNKVIAGEYPIAVMTFNHHDAISRAEGAPVDWVRAEPLLQTTSLVGLLKDAPHPNAARLFLDYVLSDEGQTLLAAHDYIPADPAVPAKVADLKPDAGHFKVNVVTPRMARDDLPKWIKLYHELFSRASQP